MKNIYGELERLIFFNNHPCIEGEYEAKTNYLMQRRR